MKQPCVYILASKRYGTLYVGVTSDLARRIWEHRSGCVDGFTEKHGVHLLVYVEFHETMEDQFDSVHESNLARSIRRTAPLGP